MPAKFKRAALLLLSLLALPLFCLVAPAIPALISAGFGNKGSEYKPGFEWGILFPLSICVTLAAFILAPILPFCATMQFGASDNNHTTEIEPRLPRWLSWFDTSNDNSLWGDLGWRVLHCPALWGTHFGMWLWLWRNPACGFGWNVLSKTVKATDTYEVTSSGCGLDLDKSRNAAGWFLIKSSSGAFQFRWVKTFGTLQLSCEAGWLLDKYITKSDEVSIDPRAPYLGEPHFSVKG